MCTTVFPACQSVHNMYTVPVEAGRESWIPQVTATGKPLCGCWELNPGPMRAARAPNP